MYAVWYSIIQNLPVATKTAFLCVSSLSFELHGAFSGNNENDYSYWKLEGWYLMGWNSNVALNATQYLPKLMPLHEEVSSLLQMNYFDLQNYWAWM